MGIFVDNAFDIQFSKQILSLMYQTVNSINKILLVMHLTSNLVIKFYQ